MNDHHFSLCADFSPPHVFFHSQVPHALGDSYRSLSHALIPQGS